MTNPLLVNCAPADAVIGTTADEIRSLRTRLGLSQLALAREIDCTASAVSHWEAGRKSPRGRNLRESP